MNRNIKIIIFITNILLKNKYLLFAFLTLCFSQTSPGYDKLGVQLNIAVPFNLFFIDMNY